MAHGLLTAGPRRRTARRAGATLIPLPCLTLALISATARADERPEADVFKPGLSIQPRLTGTLSGDPDASDEDAISDAGLRLRRALLTANGSVGGVVQYRFRLNLAGGLAFTDGDGRDQLAMRPALDDAQLTFRIREPLQLIVGQWKVPFSLSQTMSDTSLLLPDRPVVIDGFKYGDIKIDGLGWSRDAGVALAGTAASGRVEYAVGAFNGDGTNVWPGDDAPLIAGRIQLGSGKFKYDEVDLEGGSLRFAIGASGSWNRHPGYDDDGAAAAAETVTRAGGDLRVAVAGLSVQGEVITGATSAGGKDVRSLGAYALAGYALPIGVAPGVRWSRIDPSLEAEGDALTQVEGVVNWYLPDQSGGNLGHRAQLQLAWTTSLLEGADAPLSHQAQLAAAVTF